MLTENFSVDRVSVKLTANTKEEVISQLVRLAIKNEGFPEKIETAIRERESIRTTGFGCGIAMPHCKTLDTKTIHLSIATLSNPIEWGSVDNKPVTIVAMLIAPIEGASKYIHLLAKLSKILTNEQIKKSILDATLPQQIYDIIIFEDGKNSR